MSKKKILLADDADLILKLERAFLRRKNFHLLVARSGSQVLQILERERPDLIFLDLVLPEISGDELCSRIKSESACSSVPVVILASGQEGEIERCRAAGCDEVLLRPISRIHLTGLVRRLLDLPSRGNPRYEACLQVAYGADRSHLYSGETLNLSTGGVLIESKNLLPVDTRVFLEILLPGAAEPIRCTGRVVWLNQPSWVRSSHLPGELGVQFLDLSPAEKDDLQKYLQSEGARADR